MEKLCRAYWPPLYSFARYQGIPPADAEDLTQSFFEDLLSRGAIARADASRGRFRSFLLTSFKNHRLRLLNAANRIKRGGGNSFVSLEAIQEVESQFQPEQDQNCSPEEWYDRQWALGLLKKVVAALRCEYERIGKGDLFDELRSALWGGGGNVAYAQIAERLGMTEGAVKIAAYRLRRRFGERLQSEVAQTVLDPDEIEDEIRYLLSRVGGVT